MNMPFMMHPQPEPGSPEAMQMAELQQEAEKLSHAQAAQEVAARRRMLRFASLVCSCRPWPVLRGQRNPSPPQAGCTVHGQLIITIDGEVL